MNSSTIGTCRSCGAPDLQLILALGRMPLANALLDEAALADQEPRFPLDLALCRHCSLLQITETVPPETLFRKYLYFSSFSDTMVRHAQQLACDLVDRRKLGTGSLVVEIGSNDGYLLQHFVKEGVPVLGIEPARNIAAVAQERGIRTLPEFFGPAVARQLAQDGERADVIVANNVIAHIPDINGIFTAIKILLKDDGVFVMETPYVKALLDGLAFDTIYHEHLFYYSLTALEALFRRNGLAASNVEHVSTHGGSLRVTVTHAGREGARPEVDALLEDERRWGVGDDACYREFAEKVIAASAQLLALLTDLKSSGKRIAAYGAAAKGTTLLNFMNVDTDLVEFVVDRSTHKQGCYVPGVRVPIRPVEELLTSMPDYVLMLAWNLADEIIEQQSEYRSRGGRFILPMPTPTLVPAAQEAQPA